MLVSNALASIDVDVDIVGGNPVDGGLLEVIISVKSDVLGISVVGELASREVDDAPFDDVLKEAEGVTTSKRSVEITIVDDIVGGSSWIFSILDVMTSGGDVVDDASIIRVLAEIDNNVDVV